MRWRRGRRGAVDPAIADLWWGRSWCCECGYTNVGSDHCYYCDTMAPAGLRAEVASVTGVETEPATSDS